MVGDVRRVAFGGDAQKREREPEKKKKEKDSAAEGLEVTEQGRLLATAMHKRGRQGERSVTWTGSELRGAKKQNAGTGRACGKIGEREPWSAW